MSTEMANFILGFVIIPVGSGIVVTAIFAVWVHWYAQKLMTEDKVIFSHEVTEDLVRMWDKRPYNLFSPREDIENLQVRAEIRDAMQTPEWKESTCRTGITEEEYLEGVFSESIVWVSILKEVPEEISLLLYKYQPTIAVAEKAFGLIKNSGGGVEKDTLHSLETLLSPLLDGITKYKGTYLPYEVEKSTLNGIIKNEVEKEMVLNGTIKS